MVMASGRLTPQHGTLPETSSEVFKISSKISQDLLGRPMVGETKHFYEFGTFRVDLEKQLLLHDNLPVPLSP